MQTAKMGIVTLVGAVLLTLAGCRPVSQTGCWTRAQLAAERQDISGMPHGLKAGTFRGQIVLPDPSNPATGVRFTGIPCQTRIWRDAQGRLMAQPSFLEQPARLTLGESGFYAGLVDDGTALVVQQYPGGVTSTHTVFDASGVIVYGICGSRAKEFLRECHSPPQ